MSVIKECQDISHITFVVRDPERMALLLCEGLGATELYDSDGKNFSLSREKFFLFGGVWIAVMEGEPPAERSYQHVAFKVTPAALPTYRARLELFGVEIKPPRSRVEGEGESLYFYDFDNHLFELHTGTLEERLARYAGVGKATDEGCKIH
jgi:fosfomycin resistance protein FosX